jgi:uncharacterized membrane protein YidH (DUF202 family)
MVDEASNALPARPKRVEPTPVPPLPEVDENDAERASTTYSHYRTGLSNHRTGLSEHRTDLSEYRTDLSTHRTNLSTNRTEMSMRRTGMSFHRTRMSADRTLMSVIRTSLSLIGFGFTLYQIFAKLHDAGTIKNAAAPRNFGLTLILLGSLLLIGGIWRQLQFALELRASRVTMTRSGLIHGESRFPISITLVTAVALLAIGLAAFVSIAFSVAVFG